MSVDVCVCVCVLLGGGVGTIQLDASCSSSACPRPDTALVLICCAATASTCSASGTCQVHAVPGTHPMHKISYTRIGGTKGKGSITSSRAAIQLTSPKAVAAGATAKRLEQCRFQTTAAPLQVQFASFEVTLSTMLPRPPTPCCLNLSSSCKNTGQWAH